MRTIDEGIEYLKYWIRKQIKLLPLIRIAISAVSCCLMPMMSTAFMDSSWIAIPSGILNSVLFIGCVLNLYFTLTEAQSRGWLYDISCALLAPEVVLYLKWMESSFAAAVVVLLLLLIILATLRLYTRKWMMIVVKKKWLPLILMQEMLNEINHKSPVSKVFLKWAAMIVTSAMLFVPSVLAWCSLIAVEYHNPVIHESAYERRLKLFDEYAESIRLLEQKQWAALSKREKQRVLQTAADIEAKCMGIEGVRVKACPLEKIAGSYDGSCRLVNIDLSKHITGMECLNTIIHETRHAFQDDCSKDMRMRGNDTDGISNSINRQWLMELTNYISASTDEQSYYHQTTEVDARSYAAYVESTYRDFLKNGM